MTNLPSHYTATGRIPAEYVAVTNAVGAALNATFAKPIAQLTDQHLKCGEQLVLTAPSDATEGDMIVLREDLSLGQSVAQYQLEISTDSTTWQNVTTAHGQTIGNRVWDFLSQPTKVQKVRFTCLAAVVEDVYIRQFALFKSQPPQ